MRVEPTSPGGPLTADDLAAAVATHRGALVGVAYRMLGSVADAEDAVQEAFVRLERHGIEGIDNLGGWLQRTTSRLCLDRLRSAQVRREVYVGPWLPEPLPDGAVDADDPASSAELADSVAVAFLVVLEALSPAERVAFVLREVFGHDYAEVAAVLDRSEPACRQLVARARSAVEARRPRFEPDPQARAEVAGRFLVACRTGDLAELLTLLAPDVVLRSDGGGKVSAARREVRGADRVARFLLGVIAQAPPELDIELCWLNGGPAAVAHRPDGTVDTVLNVHVADGQVVGVYTVRNPDKLAHLATDRRSG